MIPAQYYYIIDRRPVQIKYIIPSHEFCIIELTGVSRRRNSLRSSPDNHQVACLYMRGLSRLLFEYDHHDLPAALCPTVLFSDEPALNDEFQLARILLYKFPDLSRIAINGVIVINQVAGKIFSIMTGGDKISR
jgi:hypothetical protein